MSILDPGRGSIRIWRTNGTYFCGTISEAEVELGLNEHWTSNMIMDYEQFSNAPSADSIDIGQTVDLWLGRGTSLHKVFSGKIGPIREEIEGKTPRWYEFEARGWGEVLSHSYFWGKTIATIDKCIKYIVEELVPGTITWNHVYTSNKTIVLEEKEPMSMQDVLTRVCDDNEWVFYVDNDRDLWAFPPGQYVSPENFENDIVALTFLKDPDQIINAQRVIGAREAEKGSDTEWTEDDDNSSCTWSSDGDVVSGGYSDVKTPDSQHGAGSKVIKTVKADASSVGPYLEILFEDAGSPKAVDLSYFGTLQFAIAYGFDKIGRSDEVMNMEIRFYSSDTEYYYCYLEIPGIDAVRIGHQLDAYRNQYGWHMYLLNFNCRRQRDVEMKTTGEPKWQNVKKVRFIVVSPLPSATGPTPFKKAWLSIDNMEFKNGYYYGWDQDAASVSKYGKREGKPVFKEDLKSDANCDELAQTLVDAYKDPLKVFERLEGIQVYPITDIAPGYEATITVEDREGDVGPATVMVRSIRYELDEDSLLRSDFELSNRYIPTLEKIIADATRDIQRLKFRDLFEEVPDTGIFKFGPPFLDFGDIDRSPEGFGNLIYNPGFDIQDRFWAPEADVPAAWIPSTVPTGADFRVTGAKIGEYRLHFWDGQHFSSWLFPVRWRELGESKDEYRFAIWVQQEHVASSLKVELILARAGEGYVKTIDVLDWYSWGNTDTWHKVEEFVTMPYSINSGYVRYSVNPNYGLYLDDSWFSRVNFDDESFKEDAQSIDIQSYETGLDANWKYVRTFTFEEMGPDKWEKYDMETIGFEISPYDPLDSVTIYGKYEMYRNGTSIAFGWGSTTPISDQWYQVYFVDANDWQYGDSIDVKFAVRSSDGSSCRGEIRNCEVIYDYRKYIKTWE